jgi:serine/threonine protein kinase
MKMKNPKLEDLVDAFRLPDLCEELKTYDVLNYGSTATVYKKNDYVLKEIYLESDSIVSRKLRELSNNIFIQMDNELSKYIPTFYGFYMCEGSMILKFAYTGKTFKEQLTDLSLEEIKKIVSDTRTYIRKFNEKEVIHGDLHLDNIFYYEGNTYISDWGKTINKRWNITKDDLNEEFYPGLFFGVYLAYFFKQNSKTSMENYLNSKNLLSKVKQMADGQIKYHSEYMSYKPKKFLEKAYKIFYQDALEIILKREFKYVMTHTKLPEGFKSYLSQYDPKNRF